MKNLMTLINMIMHDNDDGDAVNDVYGDDDLHDDDDN